jgi:molybdate transport system substrate-binding protein
VRRVTALLLLPLLLSACASSGAKHQRALTVLGAASLTEAFQAIGRQFEGAHGGVSVRFSFGPSDGLAQQIRQGAPADVFASASESWMNEVAKDPGVAGRADFARNRLTVVVPASNPARIGALADLARPGVKLVLAARGVPAGDYGREILANAGIAKGALTNVVSNEVDVKGVLAKVASGDADAGIVYVTEVTPSVSGQVRAVSIPPNDNVVATYPIAVIDGAGQAALARAFVRFVLGPGQSTLQRSGFMQAG